MSVSFQNIEYPGLHLVCMGNRRIKSAERLFSIIEAFREYGRLGVTELSDILNISKANAHHYVSTLRDYDYVVKKNDKYELGLEFFAVAVDTREQSPVYRVAKEDLARLADETGETAWCMVEQNGMGMFIDGYIAGRSIDRESIIGTWKPLHANSAGKAILANLPADRRNTIIDRSELEPLTENTITERNKLRQELKEIQERGFSTNFGEDLSGIHAVGTPIFDQNSEVAAGISVAGSATRLTKEYCKNELAPLVRSVADDIEFNLAYR